MISCYMLCRHYADIFLSEDNFAYDYSFFRTSKYCILLQLLFILALEKREELSRADDCRLQCINFAFYLYFSSHPIGIDGSNATEHVTYLEGDIICTKELLKSLHLVKFVLAVMY